MDTKKNGWQIGLRKNRPVFIYYEDGKQLSVRFVDSQKMIKSYKKNMNAKRIFRAASHNSDMGGTTRKIPPVPPELLKLMFDEREKKLKKDEGRENYY